MAYALETLAELSNGQCEGIIVGRGYELGAGPSASERAGPVVNELLDLLAARSEGHSA